MDPTVYMNGREDETRLGKEEKSDQGLGQEASYDEQRHLGGNYWKRSPKRAKWTWLDQQMSRWTAVGRTGSPWVLRGGTISFIFKVLSTPPTVGAVIHQRQWRIAVTVVPHPSGEDAEDPKGHAPADAGQQQRRNAPKVQSSLTRSTALT
ncbi:hypothetical protein BCR34DRAFT_604359 [Clohesyomyces aquaticus]|uniref:Uncharacterized protein n=1 Tax=Clohesyomyces aquaticus TaxID=1231657 RepID=A0A1Y1Z6M7_9PLEO|nr:hypothetical protein BCR34DRAFT_604359 [Clohesyomyces aquaticus]